MLPSTITHSTGDVAESATDRLVKMLNDPSEEPITLTRAQLAYLMSSAGRWSSDSLSYQAGYDAGYQARVTEENDAYTKLQPVKVLGRWFDQAAYRQRCDEQARTPREDDYAGGAVEVW